MARFRRVEELAHDFAVADLANEDHVWILPQEGFDAVLEVLDVRRDASLCDYGFFLGQRIYEMFSSIPRGSAFLTSMENSSAMSGIQNRTKLSLIF